MTHETENIQKQTFLSYEGDQWFERNRAVILENPITTIDTELIGKFLHAGNRVLEIGCCSGTKLNLYHEKVPGYYFGIDPSKKAIQLGTERFPHLQLHTATADALPFADRFFDVVIFGFCLYLIDRPLLSRVVYEADRVLKNRGFLAITDFDVVTPTKRRYHHISDPEIFSYKMDYPRLFLAFPDYSVAEKISYSQTGTSLHPDPQQRYATTVLYKDTDNAYAISV